MFRTIFQAVPALLIKKNVQSKFIVIMSFTAMELINNIHTKMQLIFNEFWKHELLNVNILAMIYNPMSGLRMDLYTYFPYMPQRCSMVTLYRIDNPFESISPDKSPLLLNKLNNFNECPVELVTFDTPSGIEMVLIRDKNGEVQDFRGFEGAFLKSLAKQWHFSIKVITPDELWGEIYSNGSASGAMELMINRKINLSIGLFHQTYQYNELFDLSASYYSTNFCFVIPPGRPYTSIEKLLSPFRADVWYYLLALVASIVTMKLFSLNSYQHRIIEPVAIQDFIRIGMGIDVIRLPKLLLSKLFLMILIFGSLIIRTIYQGSLFTFLISLKNFPPLGSIQQMVDEGFLLYLPQALQFLINFIPNIQNR